MLDACGLQEQTIWWHWLSLSTSIEVGKLFTNTSTVQHNQIKMLQPVVYLILPQRLECGLEQIFLFVFYCRTVHSLDVYHLHTWQPLLLVTAHTAFALVVVFAPLPLMHYAACTKPMPACITSVKAHCLTFV